MAHRNALSLHRKNTKAHGEGAIDLTTKHRTTTTTTTPTQFNCTHRTGKDFRHGKHTKRTAAVTNPQDSDSKRPDKKRAFCPACHRDKMLFGTRQEAERFMAYNSDAIAHQNGYAPQRAYYCKACRGWHLTSQQQSPVIAHPTRVRQKWYRLERCLQSALHRIQRRRMEEAQRVFSIAFSLYEDCIAAGVPHDTMDQILDRLTEYVNLWVQTERDNERNSA